LLLVVLIMADCLNLACVALLVGTSGLVFGGDPERANGDTTAVVLWLIALTSCFMATIAGFFLRARGMAFWAVLVALTPPAIGACFFTI
jgi:hypothetical protein